MLNEIRYTFYLLGMYGKTPYQFYDIWNLEARDHKLKVKSGYISQYDFEGKTVADVGCNAGYYSLMAAKEGASYVKAFDWSPSFRELVRIQARIHKYPIVPTDERFFEVDEKFNIVMALAIVHHLTYQRKRGDFDPEVLRGVIQGIAHRTTEAAFLEYAGDYQHRYWKWGTTWNEDVFREACEAVFPRVTLIGQSVPKERRLFLCQV